MTVRIKSDALKTWGGRGSPLVVTLGQLKEAVIER